MIIDGNFVKNIIYSVEDFINTNVVTPYNSTVSPTTYANPVHILIDNPDDASLIVNVPAIVLEMPEDNDKYVEPIGMGDGLVWTHKRLYMRVYPGLSTDTTTGAQKPSIQSMAALESYFSLLSTALTIPIYDYSSGSKSINPIEGAYIDEARTKRMSGRASMLALDKHRFDFILDLKIPVRTLNG